MTERQVPERRWDHYHATVVVIAHEGEVVEARDLARRLDATIHVITAWNPGADRPGDAVNRAQNEKLRADLAALIDPVLPALGVSTAAADPAEPHSEGSWAVIGLDRDLALTLGAKYRQEAIFEITATSQEVVECPLGTGGTGAVS